MKIPFFANLAIFSFEKIIIYTGKIKKKSIEVKESKKWMNIKPDIHALRFSSRKRLWMGNIID